MENNTKSIESLLESTVDYGRTSFELVKFKTIDKTADLISTMVPNTLVLVMVSFFMLFLGIGLAYWLGEILGKLWFGFFAVAVFYGISAIVFHFLMHPWIKKMVSDSIIKRVLN